MVISELSRMWFLSALSILKSSCFTPESVCSSTKCPQRTATYSNIYSTKTISSFSRGKKEKIKNSWNLYSAHLPTLLCLADFPASSAGPNPSHISSASLWRLKLQTWKVGRWPGTGRGDILLCYFWVALPLNDESGLMWGAPKVLLQCRECPEGEMCEFCAAVFHKALQKQFVSNRNVLATYIYLSANVIH